MLYTIAGALIGGFGGYFVAKMQNVDFRSNGWLFSNGELFTLGTTIIGAAIGFGIGSTKLLNGTYLRFN